MVHLALDKGCQKVGEDARTLRKAQDLKHNLIHMFYVENDSDFYLSLI